MNKVQHYLIIAIASIFFIGCESDSLAGLEEFSLLEYGVPVTILAPAAPDVKSMNYGKIRDITVSKGNDYNLQILYSSTNTLDVSKIVASYLDTTKGNRNFEELIREDESGFIYKYKFSNEKSFYAFKKVKVMADHEILFQSGMASQFELDDIEKMYKAIQ